MTSIIANWGNSLAIRIPKKEIVRLGLGAGSKVRFISTENGMAIEPIRANDADYSHLLDRQQILALSKKQYGAYIARLSQDEREEVWRREDRNETISDAFLKAMEQEAEQYFSK